MKRFAVCLLLLACVSMSTGCIGRAVKEGLGIFGGAKGFASVRTPISADPEARPLGVYTRFVVEPFDEDADTAVPQVIKDTLADNVAKVLADKKIPNEASGRTLTIRGKYIYYEAATKATSQLFGPFEEVVARVQLMDGRTVVGEATCVGRSTESVNQGPEKKSQGLAKGIVDWIDKNYPKRD